MTSHARIVRSPAIGSERNGINAMRPTIKQRSIMIGINGKIIRFEIGAIIDRRPI